MYIVHQTKPGTKTYDEDKVMLGFSDSLQAKRAYLSNYDRSDMFGSMEMVTTDELKEAIDRRKGRKLTKAIRVMVRRLRKAQGANPRLVPKRISFMQNGRQVTRTQLVLPERYTTADETLRFMRGKALVELSGDEFRPDGTRLSEKVLKFFNSIGNKVEHPVLGRIDLDRESVKSSIGHKPNRLKVIAYSAIPLIVRSGTIIDYQRRWKGRNHDTYVIAGPIMISNTRYLLAAVVSSVPDKKRYYAHDLIIEKESQEGSKPGHESTSDRVSDKYPPGTIKRLLSKYTVVNTDVRKSAHGGLAPGKIMVRRSDGKRGCRVTHILRNQESG